MDRQEAILKHVDRSGRGIEIGPWINPIAPKRDGLNCLVMDVFDTATLKARANSDSNISSRTGDIEEVDLVGSSTEIEAIVGRRFPLSSFDYVVSSHNFEHLANPIKFLQGSAKVLKLGGVLAMAVPDHRACFDFFRPLTRLTEWLDWYHRKLERPSLAQHFDHRATFAYYGESGGQTSALRDADPAKWCGPTNLQAAYSDWTLRITKDSDEYLDSHVSVFTPSSFELLIHDCSYLGLIPLRTIEVFDAGSEFHAHLQVVDRVHSDSVQHLRRRNALLQQIKDEEAECSSKYRAAILATERLKEEIADLQGMKMTTSEVWTALEATNVDLRNALAASQAAVEALRGSTSWRITAPIRWLRDSLKQFTST